jgi:hypothetical protein
VLGAACPVLYWHAAQLWQRAEARAMAACAKRRLELGFEADPSGDGHGRTASAASGAPPVPARGVHLRRGGRRVPGLATPDEAAAADAVALQGGPLTATDARARGHGLLRALCAHTRRFDVRWGLLAWSLAYNVVGTAAFVLWLPWT